MSQIALKAETLGLLEESLARYRACFQSTDYILAWDNGLGVKGACAVLAFDADTIDKDDSRRWFNGANQRAYPQKRAEVCWREYRKLAESIAQLMA